jgi:glycosyltransferase involved in cell wall biosynthesis
MTSDTVGGVWTYSIELARALQEHGVDVYLATMGARLTSEQWREASSLSRLTVIESDYKLEWMDDPWHDVARAGDWLLAVEGKIRPDAVHLNGYCHGGLPWHAPVLMVGHSCVLSWWRAVKGEEAPPRWRRYREEVARGLRSAALVVSPSHAMLGELERYYGPFPASGVVPNFRDPRPFAPGEKQPFILAAGRLWDEAKNVAAVDAVAADLAWPVYVAGDEEFQGGKKISCMYARSLGRLGPEAMPLWFARASIFAHPARYEPFGLSALEAGMAGCALVLGDIPSLREVWADAAVYVPPNDRDSLKAALAGLIEDDVSRVEMSHRARTRALDYSPNRMVGQYLAAYHSIGSGLPVIQE